MNMPGLLFDKQMYYKEPEANPLLPPPCGIIKTVVKFKQCRSSNHASVSLIFFPGVADVGMMPGEPEALWRQVSDKIMKGRFWILSEGSRECSERTTTGVLRISFCLKGQ